MSFTDDDLKRLKAEVQSANNEDDFERLDDARLFADIEALLTRLEAAEYLAKLKHFHEPHGWCDCEQSKAFAIWRKAAGK